MRLWAKNMAEQMPQHKTKLTIASVLVDACILGLLIAILISHSCEICFQTGMGYKTCKSVPDMMTTGLPTAVANNWGADNEPRAIPLNWSGP